MKEKVVIVLGNNAQALFSDWNINDNSFDVLYLKHPSAPGISNKVRVNEGKRIFDACNKFI